MAEAETLTLAPAAGAGIGKALADLLLADPDFLAAMKSAAMDGLKATRSFWCGKGGEGYLETEPDFRIRVQTMALLLAHMEGEPVKRIIHQHLGAGGKLDFKAALQESPELAQALSRELDKANWKTSGHQAHKRPKKVGAAPAEVEPGKPADAF